MLTLVLIIILIALLFDFFNGFNDAANSIATIVSTRVLSPGQAVAWAAFWNFIAAFAFVPCDSENAAALNSCARRNHWSTVLGRHFRKIHATEIINPAPAIIPTSGETKMKISVTGHLPGTISASIPPRASAAPA
jgi:hypothetical protein